MKQIAGMILCILCFGILHGQQVDWNEKVQDLRERTQDRSGFSDYRLGPGDLIEITVFGVEELRQTRRISTSGAINVPLLEAFQVSGLTVSELERLLARRWEEEDLVKDPQVSVTVLEYESKPVVVLGVVNRPGEYQLKRGLHLVDLLALAGGIQQERAEGIAVIQRSRENGEGDSPGEPGSERSPSLTIDLKRLLEEGDKSLNVRIRPGDVVNVPERKLEEFYVIGEVHRPGAFSLPVTETFSLTQAVAKAGGPMKTAKMTEGVLIRQVPEVGRVDVPVDLKGILEGRKPDLQIQPNDVIFVPGSTFKNISYALLGIIPRTISETIARTPR